MSDLNALALTFIDEWEEIRTAMLRFADQVYGMNGNERAIRINDLLVLLQDLVDLLVALKADAQFSNAILKQEEALNQAILELEKQIAGQAFFEMGEVVRYEVVPVFDAINEGVGAHASRPE